MWSPDEVAFVVATHQGDVHYCRALLASIRHYHPDHRIFVLVDGEIGRHDLPRWPNLTVRPVAEEPEPVPGLRFENYLAKLALFFWDDVPAYAYFDADSVLVAPLFDSPLLQEPADLHLVWARRWRIDQPEGARTFRSSILDLEAVRREVDPTFAPAEPIGFLSGNFVVRSGAVSRELLRANLSRTSTSWQEGRVFHHNDQSLLNYVVNRQVMDGELDVALGDEMVIPRDGVSREHPGITLDAIERREPTGTLVLHWTTPCRVPRFADHDFGEVLTSFEDRYYATEGRLARWRDRARRRLLQARRRAKRIPARLGSLRGRARRGSVSGA